MADAIDRSDLAAALALGDHEMICLVGGGGKTTTLLALGRQLTGRVILTTTTKMGLHRTGGFDVLWSPSDAEVANRGMKSDDVVASEGRAIGGAASEREVRTEVGVDTSGTTGLGRWARIAWSHEHGGKAVGPPPETVDRWFHLVDHVVVEADGARRLPFKAPAGHEPVIPSRATTVLAIIGADALDRVIEDQCFRPMRVAAVAGCSPYQRLTPERAARVLASADGSRRGVAPSARFAVLITKVATSNAALARATAAELAERGVQAVQIREAPPP